MSAAEIEVDDSVGAAIIEAATALVGESGLAGFSMDAVAARARVSKSSIYKRWPSRERLVLAVCSQLVDDAEAPDTGSVFGDLALIIEGLTRSLASPISAVAVALADAAERDPLLEDVFRGISAKSRRHLEAALRRGVDKGELAADADVGALADMLSGAPFYVRFVLRGEMTGDYVARLLANLPR